MLLRRRVRRPSPLKTVTAALGLSFAGGIFGCDTDAIGVSECRQIEASRCSAATACGFADEASCLSYYQGHCLHGLAVEVVDASDVEDCVSDIEAAGTCARDQGPETAPSSCSAAVVIVGREVAVCDLVRQPERLQSCAFLGEIEEEEEDEPETTGDAGG